MDYKFNNEIVFTTVIEDLKNKKTMEYSLTPFSNTGRNPENLFLSGQNLDLSPAYHFHKSLSGVWCPRMHLLQLDLIPKIKHLHIRCWWWRRRGSGPPRIAQITHSSKDGEVVWVKKGRRIITNVMGKFMALVIAITIAKFVLVSVYR
jgi:hypothetical protein